MQLHVSKAWNPGDKYFVFLKVEVVVGMKVHIILYYILLNIFIIIVIENK